MSNEPNIELVKQLLRDKGFVIDPKSQGLIVYAYREKQTCVCSWLALHLTVSISIDGKAKLNKAMKITREIFGKRFAIEHLASFPTDGKRANYFSCQVLH